MTTSETGSGAGRFAPSPSSDLHLGNLRTALLAWLFARSTGRAFRWRVEDLDVARSATDGVAEGQLADALALGLDVDGPVLRQSERQHHYAAAVERLGEDVYECFCTRREIAEASSAPHDGFRPYPGTCRDLTEEQRAERRRRRPAALRVRTDTDTFEVDDLLAGRVGGLVDDFVLRRGDGAWAYNLAVVVDDAATGVDQVVRGDDLLTSAPRQAWLAQRLGYRPPTYAHVPLAVNADGRRLAKRDGAVTLAELTAAGVSAQDVLARLAVSLRLATAGERVDVALLLSRFDPAALPREPWVVEG
ncbi:tRNA glutamyl-Q(34) synthetase GluQRS [Desertihabitans brevis]|uniref:Glutamyl-Q tRNA(Asp) synthetase n=1 Tax=Desertihabitans brevis TaxID=2268447 RepID=A0A367YZW2_9ACTN|nr:tRNA glutamyl-Q(34) synthetase GluQRS [Desertihabitans brevis]RCK71445.1 tRNA glutamyl-Q(34) synthetase GluQRS [Desertihabitans brevis]